MSKTFYITCCENKDSSFYKKNIDEIWFDYNFSESFTSGNLISISYKNVKTNLKVQNNSKTRMVGI